MLGNMHICKDSFSDKMIVTSHHSFISNMLLRLLCKPNSRVPPAGQTFCWGEKRGDKIMNVWLKVTDLSQNGLKM